MPFQQVSRALGNQYADDRVLRSYLARVCPAKMLADIEPSLIEMGGSPAANSMIWGLT